MAELSVALDRALLRLWWWAEGRAFDRMMKRWPSEYEDWKLDPSRPRHDFLTDAYAHLVESPTHPAPAPGEDYANHYGETL